MAHTIRRCRGGTKSFARAAAGPAPASAPGSRRRRLSRRSGAGIHVRLCDDAREDPPDGRSDDLATRCFEEGAMGALIAARMASTAEMLACFDDAALVAAALRFERELAV